MNTFSRMIVQTEMDYRGSKLQRGARSKRRNRLAESHRQPFVVSPTHAKRAS